MNWKSGPQERGEGSLRGVLAGSQSGAGVFWGDQTLPSSGGRWPCPLEGRHVSSSQAQVCVGFRDTWGEGVACTSRPRTFPASLGHLPPCDLTSSLSLGGTWRWTRSYPRRFPVMATC